MTDRIYLILAACCLTAVSAIGVTASYYRPLVAAANARADSFALANEVMGQSVFRQNQLIVDLQDEAKRREQSAKEAVNRARVAAKKQLASADSILIQKPPVGVDKCEAARDAFAQEIKAERGAK